MNFLSMNNMRGVIRPVVTVAVVWAYLHAFLHPAEFPPDRLSLLHPTLVLVLSTWFGERFLKNLGLDLGALLARKVKP